MSPEFTANSIWLFKIGFAIVLLVILNYLLRRLISYARHRAALYPLDWRAKLDKIGLLPMRTILWILGISYVVSIAAEHFGTELEFVPPLRNAAVICCLAWILIRWKSEVQQLLVLKGQQEYKMIDASMVHMAGRILTVAIIILTALIVLQVLGINVVPLVAFGGIGAAALGFAAKDVIANFFGGLMLYITKPFFVEDLIILPDHNIEGHVEEIGWYLTSIRDKQKRAVYLPNSMFSTVQVINSSRMTHRRFEEKIGVRFEDFSKIKPLVDEIKKFLSSHSQIDTHYPVMVFFDAFGEYALNIYIDTYCQETQLEAFLAVKQDLLISIYEIITKHGAEMPYPTSVIEMADPSQT